jgi:hypothetical protein
MNPSLVPTAIVDKNGKKTVVHKKLAGTKPASNALAGAAPKLSSPAKKRAPKPYKPSSKQLFRDTMPQRLYQDKIDTKLLKAVKPNLGRKIGDSWQPVLKISDVEGYGVFSAVDTPQNALALLTAGIRTADEAHGFLIENNLKHIAREGNPVAQSALERRIPFPSFLDFDVNLANVEMSPETYLDTAEANGHFSLRKLPEIIKGIRDETIDLQDVKDVNVITIGRAETRFQIPSLLKGIKSGEKDFTAKQLRTALEKSMDATAENIMINMLQRYGGDVADSIGSTYVVKSIHELASKDRLSEDETQAACVYGDKFVRQAGHHYSLPYELFRAGVDLNFAVKVCKDSDDYTALEVIGLYNGIAAPLVDGWL